MCALTLHIDAVPVYQLTIKDKYKNKYKNRTHNQGIKRVIHSTNINRLILKVGLTNS